MAQERALRHDRCGTFEWEWPDDRTSDPWEAAPFTCPACHKIDTLVDKMRDSAASTRGQSVRLYRGN